MGKTPIYAGFLGILTIIVASWLTPDKTVRMTLTKVADALAEAARGSVQVTIACAAIGVIICVVTMTGIGATLAFNIVSMTDNTLWMILLVVMLVCIVLSMGLPSTALYIVVAVTVSPILIKAGVMPLAAHFFCLLVWRVIQYYSSGRPSELYTAAKYCESRSDANFMGCGTFSTPWFLLFLLFWFITLHY